MSEGKETKVIPFIEGDTINLCPANVDHVDLYTKWMNDPQLRKYARYNVPQTIEEVKKLFEPKKEAVMDCRGPEIGIHGCWPRRLTWG